MTPDQTDNFDSLSSDLESTNNLLDILSDLGSTSDSSKEDESSATVKNNSDSSEIASESAEQNKVADIAEFEKLAFQASVKKNQPDNFNQNHNPESTDIEVEVEPKQDITLQEAVEYQAFLQQKADPEDNNNSQLDQSNDNSLVEYQSALEIDTEAASTEELADAVNTLIPLIVELLKYKIDDSQESILKGVTPIVERIIEQRSDEEPQKMAAAIARILPAAIEAKINLSPEEIARAIAPEIALSIKEQIRIDEDAISEALGSEMGKAIKTQIEVEKDAMVDALYPVIGDTISKYMVEVVQEINRKVENTLSIEGFQRKLRARMKGVSEAELILQESIGCHVQAILLIDKDSGLIIQEIQRIGEQALDSEMVGGMLTAIRKFANDCIVSGSELDTIDYGNWQIHLEAAGYCYLAVVLKGDPTRQFINRIRQIFGEIVLHHSKEIEKFSGNLADISPAIKLKLAKLLEPEEVPVKKASSPTALLWLLALILAIVLLPWGISSYRSQIAKNIEQTTIVQLDQAPELSVYRLEPTVERGILTIQGRVPSEYLRNQAATIAQQIAQQNNLQLNNQILTVDVPINPTMLTGEIARLTKLFNQQAGIAIQTKYEPEKLYIEGFVLDKQKQTSLIEAFNQIPGIKQIIIDVADRLPQLKERIYFDSAANKINFADNSSKIETAAKFLNQYPQLHLRLVAYSDGIGSKQINQTLSRQRCSNVKDALIATGIDSSRLEADCSGYRISTRQPNQTVKLIRYVAFKPFIPTK